VRSGPSDRGGDTGPGRDEASGEESPAPQRPLPHPGDVHVAGTTAPDVLAGLGDARAEEPPRSEPDWVPVQGTSGPEEPGGERSSSEWEPAKGGEQAGPPREEPAWEPPPETTPPETRQDVSLVQQALGVPETPPPVPAPRSDPGRPADPGPVADPQRRRTLVDSFVAEFVASATWRATLAVLESAFPGLGMAATLTRRTDELWRTIDSLDEVGQAGLGVPVWRDGNGMAFDLSAHLPAGRLHARPRARGTGVREIRPRASWPYAGAFVIDTIDPLRYHRAVGGPMAPRDRTSPQDAAAATGRPAPQPVPTPPPGEEEDSGVVIVADLTSAALRVLDSAALWRYAGGVVAATLHDPLRPQTRVQARRALRALRRVVFIDPALGLGICLQIDVTRTPRCLLAFHVDRDDPRTPRFISL
jgi:hypothetical protein